MAFTEAQELPAYMARNSGIKLSCTMNSISEVADAYRIKNEFGIENGMLLVNPIDEEYAVDSALMNKVIDEAVAKSVEDKISGKAITGYLMKYVKEKMGSDSMEAQKHMLIQNAVLAAKVAKESKACDFVKLNFFGGNNE